VKIHLIGIGGVGVSALARLYVSRGYDVSGTNDQPSPKTLSDLEKLGVVVSYQPDIDVIANDTDLVVYSNAWPKNYPGYFDEVQNLGIKVLSYPEALGEITKEYTTVAIAGTHGKTTTTAMVLHILTKAGISPSGIVGSLLSSTGSNYVSGTSNILVIEADEYMKAFLNHHPAIVGVTNIDHDHHDIYPTLDDMKDTFRQLGENLPEIGTLICSTLDQNSWDTFEDLQRNLIDYSAIDVDDLNLLVPGQFNKRNAQLAIAVCSVLGVLEQNSKKYLESFKGTWRRQEYKGKTKSGQLVYDDYAHHPTEISASLAGFREMYPGKKITVVFQPHLYSRTRELFDDFVEVFASSSIDQIILVPVYAAREAVDESVSSEVLVNKINDIKDSAIFASDIGKVDKEINPNSEVIITMGAGDITSLSDMLIKD